MFRIVQEIENNSDKTFNVFPYRLIKRINRPDTINFFILHEGLISLLNNELVEKLTDLGLECSLSNIGPSFDGVVVGKVEILDQKDEYSPLCYRKILCGKDVSLL